MILFMLPACDSASVTPETHQGKEKPHLALRQYSPISFYIAHREFVNLNPNLKEGSEFEEKVTAYVEKRLFEMEPEKKGYVGMLKAFDDQQKESIAAYKLQSALTGLSKTENEDVPEPDFPGFVTTIQQELAFLKPAEAERNDLLAVDALVKQMTNPSKTFSADAYQGQIRELRKTLVTTWLNDEETWQAVTTPWEQGFTPAYAMSDQALKNILIALGVGIAYVGTVYARAALAKKYASDEQIRLFPYSISGDKGDAFRHVYANVLLRRWVRLINANIVSWAYEQLNPNEPRHRAMDFHNNNVGHYTRYYELNGNWLLDFFDWREMSKLTHAFIQNSNNGHYIAAWRNGNDTGHPITHSVASSYTSTVNSSLYIYINP